MNDLDPLRVREMFWLFSRVLPLKSENEEQTKAIFGSSIAQILPDLAQTIGHEAGKHLELLDEYFTFLNQAIAYCRNETNDQPEVDYDQKIIFEHMRKEMKEFEKTAKPAKL